MSSVIGAGVSLSGIFIEDFLFPFNLKSGITTSDVGKAVALDTSAANTVKLAGDGDRIIGRLETVENRLSEGILVGTVSLKGGLKFPVKSGETVAIGDTIQGAGSGEVKTIAVSTDTDGTGTPTVKHTVHDGRNIVVEVGTGYAVVILL